MRFFQWLKDQVINMLVQAWNVDIEDSLIEYGVDVCDCECDTQIEDVEDSDKETLELLVQVSLDGEVIDIPIPQWVVGDEVRHTDGKSSLVIGMLFNLESRMWQYTLALVDQTNTDISFTLAEDLN